MFVNMQLNFMGYFEYCYVFLCFRTIFHRESIFCCNLLVIFSVFSGICQQDHIFSGQVTFRIRRVLATP